LVNVERSNPPNKPFLGNSRFRTVKEASGWPPERLRRWSERGSLVRYWTMQGIDNLRKYWVLKNIDGLPTGFSPNSMAPRG
jgi:hypothetical protein